MTSIIGSALLSSVAFLLMALEFEAEIEWARRPWEAPPLVARSGVLGALLQQALFWTVIIGGTSVIIWSFFKLPWYLPIILFYSIWLPVRVVRKVLPESSLLRALLASALVPPVSACGIVALQWFTWFA